MTETRYDLRKPPTRFDLAFWLVLLLFLLTCVMPLLVSGVLYGNWPSVGWSLLVVTITYLVYTFVDFKGCADELLGIFRWYRRLRGGRWGRVTGWFWGRRWIRVTDACLEFCEEDYRDEAED